MSTITEYDYLDIRLLVELLQRIVDIGEPLPSIDVISRRIYTRNLHRECVVRLTDGSDLGIREVHLVIQGCVQEALPCDFIKRLV